MKWNVAHSHRTILHWGEGKIISDDNALNNIMTQFKAMIHGTAELADPCKKMSLTGGGCGITSKSIQLFKNVQDDLL